MMQNQKLLFLVWVFLSSLYASAMDQNHEIDIHHSVAFIYYPSAREYPKGHAELEIEGISFNKIGIGRYEKKQLRNMIAKSTEDGFPFFRFLIKVDSDEIRKVQYCAEQEYSMEFICSRIALAPLRAAGLCSVPLPFSMSPLLTAAYLTAGKKMGLNNVQNIEYYGNPSLKQNLIKIVPGMLIETTVLAGLGYSSWVMYSIYKCMQEEDPRPCLNDIPVLQ